jgi:hypothetical protein
MYHCICGATASSWRELDTHVCLDRLTFSIFLHWVKYRLCNMFQFIERSSRLT